MPNSHPGPSQAKEEGNMRTIAVAMLAGLLLTGCTGDTDEPAAETPTDGDSGQAIIDTTTVDYGESADYEDSVSIVVSEPETFTPSGKATAGGEPEFVMFEVTLTNDSDSPVAATDLSFSVESGGHQAGEVIDPRRDVQGPPSPKIRPGESQTWNVGFGVLDADDVQVEVQAGMDAAPVVFGAES